MDPSPRAPSFFVHLLRTRLVRGRNTFVPADAGDSDGWASTVASLRWKSSRSRKAGSRQLRCEAILRSCVDALSIDHTMNGSAARPGLLPATSAAHLAAGALHLATKRHEFNPCRPPILLHPPERLADLEVLQRLPPRSRREAEVQRVEQRFFWGRDRKASPRVTRLSAFEKIGP